MKRTERFTGDVLVSKAIDKLKLNKSELERRVLLLEKEAQLIKEGRRAN